MNVMMFLASLRGPWLPHTPPPFQKAERAFGCRRRAPKRPSLFPISTFGSQHPPFPWLPLLPRTPLCLSLPQTCSIVLQKGSITDLDPVLAIVFLEASSHSSLACVIITLLRGRECYFSRAHDKPELRGAAHLGFSRDGVGTVLTIQWWVGLCILNLI